MIPVVQRLPKKLAWLVARHGFGVLPVVEQAHFGRGLYFATSLEYLAALTTVNTPTLASPTGLIQDTEDVFLLSLVVPGNAFPVLAQGSAKNDLQGKPGRPGYQSHYTVATAPTNVSSTREKIVQGGELVIFDPSQALPLFIWESKKTPGPVTRAPQVAPANETHEGVSPLLPAVRNEWSYHLDSTWNSLLLSLFSFFLFRQV